MARIVYHSTVLFLEGLERVFFMRTLVFLKAFLVAPSTRRVNTNNIKPHEGTVMRRASTVINLPKVVYV